MFVNHVVISLIVSSCTIALIFLIRKVFRSQMSARWQYNLWFLLLVALTPVFIPNYFFDFGNVFVSGMNQRNEAGSSLLAAKAPVFENANWVQDLTLSVNRYTPDSFPTILVGIWGVGMIICASITLSAWLKIQQIKRTASVITNQEIIELFEQCKKDVKITRNIVLAESKHVKSPMTFGVFTTYVVLPSHFDEWLSINEMKYIFLHELMHKKNNDIVMNYVTVVYQLLYWFHPLVWLAFREMRVDREIACDVAVLNFLDKRNYPEYGHTIIKFLDKESRAGNVVLANQLNGSKKAVKKRIEKIASHNAESKLLQLKSTFIFSMMGILVASQVLVGSALADDRSRYHFQDDRTIYEDLDNYFRGYEGSFVLYDWKADQYRIYNKAGSTQRISPNSTYKIFLTLFGLETDVISRESSLLKWDGIRYPYEQWNHDQDLFTAMRYSTNWYFKELDKSISPDTLQAFLEQLNYGNYNTSGGIGEYWIESSLKISPVEQVQLLKAFYTNQFGFQENNIQTVKDSIRLSEKAGSILSGKTGTGAVNQKDVNGWFVGYVENEEGTYFFATNIQSEDDANGSAAAEITLSILKAKGLF
ncbi:BlaR1 family beta-lactam sensor/signal transducer [Brevibacillus porteri]|uniref:BlaR1 family beta-lactam sensor/signal transducer n=1 Tax=Brevibacillus porteri TaxID=2126350 RepID=A0ABX5FJX3_9BACL|nr:BlaR1 family beta-lactam sensor/signal transducer [Brevibacillus porteri]MED1797510.1 BlaR1 family beta-lactam sensor/signal transducer [Brevibacillus porteri]MED2130750.1 BlaR1 family beta-lactam sensor/signal transducer [Brevibacillus porteri]MED2744989.1 BlaR1 family beta-lactam sensor/signal transducer [Brevibacillus porteri]MED2815917.1 BlaR1 family beta-lactam sensor/signal transducer [Brevibacillus porteri]MED2895036.1 BlaR1 family beta-lactam sensor/signal transducer [Brevibacillus 